MTNQWVSGFWGTSHLRLTDICSYTVNVGRLHDPFWMGIRWKGERHDPEDSRGIGSQGCGNWYLVRSWLVVWLPFSIFPEILGF